ncbi:hypothetical protein V8E36_009846 [Tilletia maclaganii]
MPSDSLATPAKASGTVAAITPSHSPSISSNPGSEPPAASTNTSSASRLFTFDTPERINTAAGSSASQSKQARIRAVASSTSSPEARKRTALETADGETTVPSQPPNNPDSYNNLTALELRVLLCSRDAQILQLQRALKVASKSNEVLGRSNESLTKSVDRLTTLASSADHKGGQFPPLSPNRSAGHSPPGAPATPVGSAGSASSAQGAATRTFATTCSLSPLPLVSRSRSATQPSSAYAQCYIKIASMRISVIRSNLAFMDIPVDLIHNIACPTHYATELTCLKVKEEQLLAAIRKAGFRLLPSFDPARPAKVDATTELKERVKAQYIERMTGEILSAHQSGARGLAEYFKQLVATLQGAEAESSSRSSSSASSSPPQNPSSSPSSPAGADPQPNPPAVMSPTHQATGTPAPPTASSSAAATSAAMDHDHSEPSSGAQIPPTTATAVSNRMDEDTPRSISAGSGVAN